MKTTPVDQMDGLRAAAIVEATDDAVVGKTLDGVIQSWNPAAARIFGWTADEIVGHPIFELIPEELHEEERSILARLARGERLAYYETTRLRKDGARIRVSLTISPIRDASGRVIGAASIKRDVTHQRTLEEQLRQSLKMDALGHFASGIAHDFNNFLTAIQGYAALALRHTPPESTTARDIEGIQQAAARGGDLIRQLLAFGRSEPASVARLDLAAVVREDAALLARLLGGSIRLELDAVDKAPVFADRAQLTQMLLNLVVNARDAMPDGGTITIATAADATQVVLVVRDSGVGMDAETRSHIFEPFFTTKGRGHGTGLGLATVYGIVQQAHGAIAVESAPGEGTTFRLTFPRADAP